MRRRALLRSVSVLGVVGVAGCSAFGASARPELEMKHGSGTLHPASEQFVTNGLEPGGHARVHVTATADEAPDVLEPDASQSIASTLRNSNPDSFHVVAQIRSSPAAPMDLWPVTSDPFGWPDRWTLRATVRVEPWISLEQMDDEDRREELRSADDLVFTSVWTLSPDVEELPKEIELELATRD